MPAKTLKKKGNVKVIEDEDEEMGGDEQHMGGSSDDAVRARLESTAKNMEKERAAVLKKIQKHEADHKNRVEEIDMHFKKSINEAFTTFKDTELYIDDEIARYINAFATTIGALEKSMQHIDHYLDKRHGGAEIIRHDHIFEEFMSLVENQTRHFKEVIDQHAPEEVAPK